MEKSANNPGAMCTLEKMTGRGKKERHKENFRENGSISAEEKQIVYSAALLVLFQRNKKIGIILLVHLYLFYNCLLLHHSEFHPQIIW